MYYSFYKYKKYNIFLLIKNSKLIELGFCESRARKEKEFIQNKYIKKVALFLDIKRQLDLYFKGKLKKFNISYTLNATNFQKKVYKNISSIKYGDIKTYKEIARSINNINSQRAVGTAISRNKITIIIPCHRVIGSSKNIFKYAYGESIKKKLLSLEKFYSKKRCLWCINNYNYIQYHDNLWGKKVYSNRKLFEFLVLESAQAGLSFLTILNKKE